MQTEAVSDIDREGESVPIPFWGRLLDLTRASPAAGAPDFDVEDIPGLDGVSSGRFGGYTWQESLDRAASSSGMRCRNVLWSLREAIGASQSSVPLVSVRRATGSPTPNRPEWFALIGQRGGRILVAMQDGSTKRMRFDAFAEWLGEESLDTPRCFIAVTSHFSAGARPPSRGSTGTHAEGGATPESPHGATRKGRRPFDRLVDLLRPDQADLWAFLLFASLIGALTLATPVAVQQLVNSIAFGGLIQPVVVLAILLFAVLGFSAVLSAVQAFVAELIQRRIFVRVVLDVSERLPRVRPHAFDSVHGPELVNRVFDVVTVQKVGSLLLLEGTSVLLQTIVGLAVLSFYHPLMLGFSGALIAGIVAVVVVMGRGAVNTAIAESKAKYEVVNWLEELARHTKTFRARSSRRYARRRTDALASGYVKARRNHYRIVFRQLGSALALQVVASSALLALGGMLVVQGQLTLGQLVASELIITVIVAAVAKFGKQLESFYDLLAAMDKLSALVDLPLEREGGGDFEEVMGPAEIALEGVSFAYGEHRVLEDVDLRIEAGSRVLVQGPMGVGKSAIFDAVAGLREPAAGAISFDGRDYRDIRLEELRESIAIVREPEVFDGSVIENLQVGRRRFEHAEGECCARAGRSAEGDSNAPGRSRE